MAKSIEELVMETITTVANNRLMGAKLRRLRTEQTRVISNDIKMALIAKEIAIRSAFESGIIDETARDEQLAKLAEERKAHGL